MTSSGLRTTWQLARLLRGGDQLVEGPGLFERDLIEKPQGTDGDLERNGRELSLAGQVHLVGANLVGAQIRRRPTESTARIVRRSRCRRVAYAEKDSEPACPRACVDEGTSSATPLLTHR